MYCIAYPGGCYGNFVAWTLEWMQGKYPVDYRPFTIDHNSHAWKSPYKKNIELALVDPVQGCMVHPIQAETDTIESAFNKLFTVYEKIIALYPAPSDFVWHLNNKQAKIYQDGWIKQNQEQMDMSSWQGNQKWELREFLSLYLYDQNTAETGYKDVVEYKSNKVFKIQINQIRDNFNAVFTELAEWLDIENVRTNNELTKLHADWIQNEPYLYKDKLIENIVDAIISNRILEMTELTITDESQIQHRLRNAGYEIKCYGLNEWPKTTTQLRELIYKI